MVLINDEVVVRVIVDVLIVMSFNEVCMIVESVSVSVEIV